MGGFLGFRGGSVPVVMGLMSLPYHRISVSSSVAGHAVNSRRSRTNQDFPNWYLYVAYYILRSGQTVASSTGSA